VSGVAPRQPLLGRAKQKLAQTLSSGATHGEGTQNVLCGYLSIAVLAGATRKHTSRLVVARSDRGPGDRGLGDPRGPAKLARRELLRDVLAPRLGTAICRSSETSGIHTPMSFAGKTGLKDDGRDARGVRERVLPQAAAGTGPREAMHESGPDRHCTSSMEEGDRRWLPTR